jgi:hypothetical protein
MVLGVDDAGWRQNVAVASTDPAAKTALAGVVVEIGGEGLEKGLANGIGELVLYRWRESLGWPREDAGECALSRSTQTRPKFKSRIDRAECVNPNALHH